MTQSEPGRPGAALVALGLILTITVAWWALALWPVGALEPEWLARTRAACFGAAPGGLPDAGGWILLVGEPLGMAAVLAAVWRRSLASELRWLRSHRFWRAVGSAFVVVVVATFGALAWRVTRAYGLGQPQDVVVPGVRTRLDVPVPRVALIDQHGARVSLDDFRGQTVLLTFAFGHCATVCPTVVRDLIEARRASGRGDVRLVVLTLDPWRDTAERLPSLVAHWGLAPDDRVLSGSIAEVEAALDTLGIGRRRNDVNGVLEHASTVMLLSPRARIAWRIDGAPAFVRDALLRRAE